MARYLLAIVDGVDSGQEIDLDGPLEIGRDPAVALPLVHDPLVSRRHALVTPGPDGVTLEDLGSSNGTAVNGRRIADPVRLQPGDRILLGTTTIELHEPKPPEYLLAVLSKPEVQVRLTDTLEVGRDSSAGVTLADDPLVSQRHVRLEPGPDGVLVHDLGSSNGTFVSGVLLTEPTLVQPGQQIRVGDTTLEIRAVPEPGFTLAVLEGAQPSDEVRIEGALEIGRDPEAGLVLPDDQLVSFRHARLTPSAGVVVVEDLGSSNGTFVNGVRIDEPLPLKPGDVLVVGSTKLELREISVPGGGKTLIRPPEPTTRASTDVASLAQGAAGSMTVVQGRESPGRESPPGPGGDRE